MCQSKQLSYECFTLKIFLLGRTQSQEFDCLYRAKRYCHPCRFVFLLLSVKQYMNDPILLKDKLVLKLTQLFTHRIGEGKSAATSKLIFFLRQNVSFDMRPMETRSARPNFGRQMGRFGNVRRNCCTGGALERTTFSLRYRKEKRLAQAKEIQ